MRSPRRARQAMKLRNGRQPKSRSASEMEVQPHIGALHRKAGKSSDHDRRSGGRNVQLECSDVSEGQGGLAWSSPEVKQFLSTLAPNLKCQPFTSLPGAARANLRQAFVDSGLDASNIDVSAPPKVALEDMQTIVSELSFLPPLWPPMKTATLRASLKAWAERGAFSIGADTSGLVTSPGPAAIRKILATPPSTFAVNPVLSPAKIVFERLTQITREPLGSVAPGDERGPPARVTIRDLHAGTPSTLGEPKHVDGKPSHPLPPLPSDVDMNRSQIVKRPRLIWTFDDKNPLRIISWRARACLEIEPGEVGGGIVCPERLRCEPPYLHEGMTTNLSGEQTIGHRLQLVTDPDWFNADCARAILEQVTQ